MNADRAILLVSYGEDPLHRLAELLLDQHASELPDLSRHAVLFPRGATVQRFRKILLDCAVERGHSALLPPYVGALSSWLNRFTDPEVKILSETARELVLYEALADFPEIRRRFGTWSLIDSLLALFDELILNNCHRPESLEQFQRQLREGYGITARSCTPLDQEANLVHTLWAAWLKHLAANNLQDKTLMTVSNLTRSLEQLPPNTQLYLAGFVDFSEAEIHWVKALLAKRQLTLLLHGQPGESGYQGEDGPISALLEKLDVHPEAPAPQDAYARFLRRVYAHTDNLATRAHAQAAETPVSPAGGRLSLYQAPDTEQEARAIDLQVRRWFLQGRRNIGIVTNDRKLARRVRALLERANIALKDAGGWALSTTSAATVLMRWLECLEQNFAFAPLLDLLKSPFVTFGLERQALHQTVIRFEQGVVRKYNVASDLGRYRAALARAGKNPGERASADTEINVGDLLDRLEKAAQPLRPLMRKQARPVLAYLDALMISLERLGLIAEYRKDEAGNRLLASLEELHAAVTGRGLRMHWMEFHHWLRRHLERRRFRPPLHGQGVELMGLAESGLYRFEAVIVAGCTREHLPGGIALPPFFNDGVRAQLGLPSLKKRYSVLFHDFRHLLEAAPQILISLRTEQAGEALVPSPWVERLRAFHQLAYGEAPADAELASLMRQTSPLVTDDAPLPVPQGFPAVRLPASLVPHTLSATAHQRLLDCPYQFYAAHSLGLTPVEEVREEMEKSDYGRRIHLILQAFRKGALGLPGPWRKPLTPETRPEAEALLQKISQAVFAGDVSRRFSSRGWLYRWQENIPTYLDWELERAAVWKTENAELARRRELGEGDMSLTLTGRIDRLDRGPHGYGIIDYKTGSVPHRDASASGEQTQLPFYALLMEGPVEQVLFLELKGQGLSDRHKLEGEALHALCEAVRDRLLALVQALDGGAALPAWGDNQTCAYCSMEGLCRREMWTELKDAAA